jgi:uncharacterized membrane protein
MMQRIRFPNAQGRPALNSQWVGLYERIYLLNGLIWIEVVSLPQAERVEE